VLAAPLAGAPEARAADARFVPEASSATWDGTIVTVAFTEVGVEPLSTTTVAVSATATIEAVCRQDEVVVVSTRSSATSTNVSDYPADVSGTVTATRELGVTVRVPTLTGLPCSTEVTRTLVVTLHDLRTEAVLVIPGQPVTA